jgi:hypothetical protein
MSEIVRNDTCWALFNDEHENLGARWMALSMELMLKESGVMYGKHVGGVFPEMYGGVLLLGVSRNSHEKSRVLKAVRERKLNLIVLPQEMRYPPKGNFPNTAVFFARDVVGYRRVMKSSSTCIMAPELTLGWPLDNDEYNNRPFRDVGIWLRKDMLARWNHQGGVDPHSVAKKCTDFLSLAGRASVNITDRLHFAIASLLRKRRTILLPVLGEKNKPVYTTWLRDLGCEWATTPKKALAII